MAALTEYLPSLLLAFDLIGVFFFAISGALLAVRHSFDLVGSALLATLAGLGGGIVRDVIISQGVPAAFAQPIYLAPVAVAVLVVYIGIIRDNRMKRTVLIFDTAGMAMFCVTGAEIALNAGLHPVPSALLGATTAVVGGLLRDVVAIEVPQIIKREGLYAVPALLGSTLAVILYQFNWLNGLTGAAVAGLVFTFRMVAHHYGWQAPAATFTQEGCWERWKQRRRRQPEPTDTPVVTEEEPAEGHEVSVWPDFTQRAELVLSGEHDQKLYTYDSAPIEDLEPGTRIDLEVLLGDAVLTSTATGNQLDTSSSAATCFLYEGEPIGVVFRSGNWAAFAYQHGIKLSVDATVLDSVIEYPELREVVVHLPARDEVFTQISDLSLVTEYGIPAKAEKISFTHRADTGAGNMLAELGSETEVFPRVELSVAPGAQEHDAQPAVLLSAPGDDGAQPASLYRLSAEHPAYEQISEAKEKYQRFLLLIRPRTMGKKAKQRKDAAILYAYDLTLWGWNEEN